MKELELKHLVGYLPYGLKIMVHGDFEMEMSHKRIHDNFEDDLKYISVDGVLEDFHCKPILRPLSDIKPSDFLLKYYIAKEKAGIEKELQMIRDGKYYPMRCGFELINQLMSEHFDIYGLIEKGLAISYNDL